MPRNTVFGEAYAFAEATPPGPAPEDDALAIVHFSFYLNATAAEGVIISANLINPTQAVEATPRDTSPSTIKDHAVTDVEGYAYLRLFRGVAFSQGGGVYAIEARHAGKIIWQWRGIIPDLDQIDHTDLTAT